MCFPVLSLFLVLGAWNFPWKHITTNQSYLWMHITWPSPTVPNLSQIRTEVRFCKKISSNFLAHFHWYVSWKNIIIRKIYSWINFPGFIRNIFHWFPWNVYVFEKKSKNTVDVIMSLWRVHVIYYWCDHVNATWSRHQANCWKILSSLNFLLKINPILWFWQI